MMIPTPNPSYFKLNDYLIFMDNTANKNAPFYTQNTLIYLALQKLLDFLSYQAETTLHLHTVM